MREFRYLPSEFELRQGASGLGQLVGYAAVFNSPTVIAERFREQVAPKAFNYTVKHGDIRALVNHDPNLLLGRNRAGTLRLAPDEHGLHYEIDLPDTQTGRDWHTSIERGDMTQSSFAFEAVKQALEHPEDVEELPLRTLQEVRLYDISPVTYPAYEDTEVTARSAFASLEAEGIVLERKTTAEATTEDAHDEAETPLDEQSEQAEPTRAHHPYV